MTEEGEGDQDKFDLAMSFWIDTPGYTDRDREMFVCGVEFEMIYHRLKGGGDWNQPIHRENESRVRMMCGKLGVPYTITQHEGYEGCETWSDLTTKNPRNTQ